MLWEVIKKIAENNDLHRELKTWHYDCMTQQWAQMQNTKIQNISLSSSYHCKPTTAIHVEQVQISHALRLSTHYFRSSESATQFGIGAQNIW